jgi:Fe/S biogenesis protein NfuA
MTWAMGTAEPLLQVSDEALRAVVGMVAGREGLALWAEVTGVGEDDFTYNLSLRPVQDAASEDLIEQHSELIVVVPQSSIDRLRGATIDLMGDLSSGGLVVDNPNSPSPAVSEFPKLELTGDVSERVSQVLTQQVNPSIALHRGRADLVEVTEGTAYLRLSGGCQGCGLAAVTLRRGISSAIRQSVPEIAEVVDVTDHARGVNPYFDPAEL